MDIKYQLININDDKYKGIVLKKFFPIIFFSEDMKRVDIYSAIVLGGTKVDFKQVKYQDFISEIDEDFGITFKFDIKNYTGDMDIKHEDLTESFKKQLAKTKKIWGDDCQKDFEMTSKLKELREKVFEFHKNYRYCDNHKKCDSCVNKDKDNCDINNSICGICYECDGFKLRESKSYTNKVDKINKFVFIGDISKKEISLTNPGKFEIKDNSYTIKGVKELDEGIEILNWIHTSIKFKKVQDLNFVKYSIEFPDTNKTKLIAPDFTIYIGPPEGYSINLRSSSGKLGEEPIRDFLQEVGTYQELYYEEWIRDCNILDKTMYRVLKDKIVTLKDKELKNKEIELLINFKSENGKEKTKFYFGIFLSTLLAFGIDFTRLEGLKKCFISFLFSPDIQWITTCILVMLSFFQYQRRKIFIEKSFKKTFSKFLGLSGFISLIIWVFSVFVVYQGYKHNYFVSVFIIKLIKKYFESKDVFTFINIILGVCWGTLIIYLISANTWCKNNYSTKKGLKLYLRLLNK